MKGELKEKRWYFGKDGMYRKVMLIFDQFVEYEIPRYNCVFCCKVSTFKRWARTEVLAQEVRTSSKRNKIQ